MARTPGRQITAPRKFTKLKGSSGSAHSASGTTILYLAVLAMIMLSSEVLVAQETRPGFVNPGERGRFSSTVESIGPSLRAWNIETPHPGDASPFRVGNAFTSASGLPVVMAARIPDTISTHDPAATSLLLMPTGRTLPAISGTLGLAAPYIPYAALSILPGLQLSAGGVYIFASDVGDDRGYYSYAMLKNSLYEDRNTSIAVGAAVLFWGQQFTLGGRTNWDRVALPGAFGVATIGGEENAFTFGVGLAEMAGGFGLGFDEGLLVGIGLGYETRLSSEWKLMTEHLSNLLAAGTLHTVGFRYFTGRAAFDLGVIIIPNGDITISGKKIPLILPLLGVSVHIG